jgi:hypothetical protein
MRIVYQRCCGMDVHKDSVTACVLRIDEEGEFRKQTRYFSTMTRGLKEMATWLASLEVEAIAAQYHRLLPRKGKKKTIVAVAHTLLIMAYYVAQRQRPYQELGGDYFARINADAMQRRLVKKLRTLGYEVTLTPITPAPWPRKRQRQTTRTPVSSRPLFHGGYESLQSPEGVRT